MSRIINKYVRTYGDVPASIPSDDVEPLCEQALLSGTPIPDDPVTEFEEEDEPA